MRGCWISTVAILMLLLGCSTPVDDPPASFFGEQLKKDDEGGRTASSESTEGGPREAVDVSAMDAGLVEYLAGDKPAFVATHTMVEFEELGKAGARVLYATAGDQTITGQWALKDSLLDMRFKLMDGDTLHEDAWLACTWTEDPDTVTLVCGMPKSTQFGTADYTLSKAENRWTLTLKNENDAGDDNWPLRVVVDAI